MAKNDDVELRLFEDAGLSSWVMTQLSGWRNHYEQNYENTFKEYYRIWRGVYDPNDKTRASERSKIISPATSQAIESSVAEIEEATFGRGRFFDIRDDIEISTMVMEDIPMKSQTMIEKIQMMLNKCGEYEKSNGNGFKSKAYFRASNSISELDDIELEPEKLIKLEGIGKSILDKIMTIKQTGTFQMYEKF